MIDASKEMKNINTLSVENCIVQVGIQYKKSGQGSELKFGECTKKFFFAENGNLNEKMKKMEKYFIHRNW